MGWHRERERALQHFLQSHVDRHLRCWNGPLSQNVCYTRSDRTEHRSVHSLQPLLCSPPPPTHWHFRASGNLPTALTQCKHNTSLKEGSSQVHTYMHVNNTSAHFSCVFYHNSENESKPILPTLWHTKIHCHCEAFKGICFPEMPRP